MPTAISQSKKAKSPGVIILIAASLFLSFRTFQYYPGMGLVQEAWFMVIAVAFLGVYVPWRARGAGQSNILERYALCLLLVIPVWSALSAQRGFGQPLIYGLAAQRSMIMVVGLPLLTLQGLRTGAITLRDLERTLVIMAWSTLVVFTAMALFLDPSVYFSQYGAGFVSSPRPEDSSFVFDIVFITFGFYYYGFKGVREKSSRDSLKSGVFFLFLLLVFRGRSLLLCLIASFLWFLFLWAPNMKRTLKYLLKGLIAFGFLWVCMYFLDHNLYIYFVDKFKDAFTVLFTGELTDDASANSRIVQTLMAFPYIAEHWVVGNGLLSNQWNGGFEGLLGYFHPSDIGILGVIFLYGVLGSLFYLYQFVLAISFSRNESSAAAPHRALLDAAKGSLLLFGIRSLATGQFVFSPEPGLFYLAVLFSTCKFALPPARRALLEKGFPH